jgi:chromosomal replication initiator protein
MEERWVTLEAGLNMEMLANKIIDRTGEEVWVAVVEKIRCDMGASVFNTWFANLRFKELNGDIITISAPSRFIREWVLTNYYMKLKDYVLAEDDRIKRFDLRVNAKHCSLQVNDEAEIVSEELPCPQFISYSLDARFTFDNFIVGDCNKLARAAALAVAKQGSNNDIAKGVLYIKGPVGMGKTHLLQAVAQYIELNRKDQKVMYISAEKFMHQYVRAIKANETYRFKEALRELDVLLFDDIQFICGKSGTQQEFANTLNAMMESGKMIIIASDRSPYDLQLDQRTASRLTGGLCVEIKRPTVSLRNDILRSKAEQIKMAIAPEVMDFVAKNVSASIRELEAALNKIVASARLLNHDINLELTREVLQDCLVANENSISVEKIIEVVANYYGLQQSEILSKSRAPKVSYPRQVIAFLAKRMTEKSLQDIGYKLGKRDHATVIYSVKKLEDLISSDSSVSCEVTKLMDLLQAR